MERKTYRADFDWKEALNKGSTHVVSGKSDKQLEQAEKGYETVRESCQAMTSDGKAMLYFIKKDAITVPLVKVKGDEQSGQAFERVRTSFPRAVKKLYAHPKRKTVKPIIPVIPSSKDCRHRHHAKRKGKFPKDRFGCTYYIVQQEEGHPENICASAAILGKGSSRDQVAAYRQRKAAEFFQDIEENCECASALLKLLDPVEHASYKQVYDRVIRPRRDLRAVCLKDNVFCSMVVITNLNVAPHRDASDKNTGWVATQVFGDFAGGGLVVCPDLGLMFDMQPGDMIYMRAALLEHYVTPWETGERTSCVFWTHGGLFREYDPESIEYSEKSKARRSKGEKRERKRDAASPQSLDGDLERCEAELVDDELVVDELIGGELVHRKPKKGRAHRLKERAKRAIRRDAVRRRQIQP